jgi:integrase
MLHGYFPFRHNEGGVGMNYTFQSHFSERIKDMLEYRSALGRDIVGYGWSLANFDRFCLSRYPDESSLTKELAFAWCADTDGSSGHRTQVIRGFARYLASIGDAAFLMPPGFFPYRKPDLPHLFTETELRRFFEATDHFPGSRKSPLLEYTVPTVFRLLYACGMRPQEVRLLKRADFHFGDGMIYIAEAKHCKDRRLAVNPDVMEMCRNYDRIAETTVPKRVYFFPSPEGGHYKNGWLTAKFHQCWEMSGNDTGAGRGSCTPYAFRHNFATQTLMRWVEEGKDLDAWIPYLCAYMGHAVFSSTFYYVHLLPERLRRMDFTRVSGIIPEVDDDEAE